MWIEDPLPPDCPPNDAIESDNGIYYRLVDTFPPTLEDFYSQKKKYPNKNFYVNFSECIQKSCSIFSTYKSCDSVRKAFKSHRNQKIVKIVLSSSCGLIKRTGNTPNHYSWWIKTDFDPIPFCQEEV